MMNLKSRLAVALLVTAIFSPLSALADEHETFPIFCQRVMDSVHGLNMKSPFAKAQLLNILNHSKRPTGQVESYLSAQKFIASFSNVDVNQNRIAVVLTVAARVEESQHVLEQMKHLSKEFQVGTDEALVTIKPHGSDQVTLEIPMAGVQQQVTSFMTAVEALRYPTRYEILDLGTAQRPTFDAIILGPQTAMSESPSTTSGRQLRKMELSHMAENILSHKKSSIVFQPGLVDHVVGHSPFLVAVPYQRGLEDHLETYLGAKSEKITTEALSDHWPDLYINVAARQATYLVIDGPKSFLLVSSENFAKLDSTLRQRAGQQGPTPYSMNLPASVISSIHSCLFCEVHFDKREEGELHPPRPEPAEDRYIASRRVLEKPLPQSVMVKSIQASEQARYALRESFPREMYTTDPQLWNLVNRILDHCDLPAADRQKIIATFEYWKLDNRIDVQTWGRKIAADASRSFTKYLMLRVLEELSSAYKKTHPSSSINPEKIQDYEEARKFLDALGFPKLVNPYKKIYINEKGEAVENENEDDLEEMAHQLAAEVKVEQLSTPEQQELANLFRSHDGSLEDIIVRIKPSEQAQFGATKFFKRITSSMRVRMLKEKGEAELTKFDERLSVVTSLIGDIHFAQNDLEAARSGSAPAAIRLLSALELLGEVWKVSIGPDSHVDGDNLHEKTRFETFMHEIGI